MLEGYGNEYCDDLFFSAFVFADEHFVQMNELPFYGLPVDDESFWLFAYVRSERMSEIILDMTGCLDADAGAY